MSKARWPVLIIIGMMAVLLLSQVNSAPFIDWKAKNPRVPEDPAQLKLQHQQLVAQDTVKPGTEVVLDVPFADDSNEGLGLYYNRDLETYSGASSIAVTDDGRIFVNDVYNNRILAYRNNQVVDSIAFDPPASVSDFDVTTDGRFLFAADRPAGTLHIVNLAKGSRRQVEGFFEPHVVTRVSKTAVVIRDFTGLPDDNLRVRKVNGNGNILSTAEQHNYDLNLTFFEDPQGRQLKVTRMGPGQYDLSLQVGDREVAGALYKARRSDDEWFQILHIVGTDAAGRVYIAREVTRDRKQPGQLFVDVADIHRGTVTPIALPPMQILTYTENCIDVSPNGDIYLVESDAERFKVLQTPPR